MKVILFGATGMVGQGVLRECLLDADVESVLVVGRRARISMPSELIIVIPGQSAGLNPESRDSGPVGIALSDKRKALARGMTAKPIK
jgi:hypothetical protein